MPLIAPSILAADFSRLGAEVAEADRAGADWLHLDVMDGHFVPNLTFGPPLLKSLRAATAKPFDAHLMISQPSRYAAAFAQAGADWISFHLECGEDPAAVLGLIRGLGKKAGLAIKPGTPVAAMEPFLGQLDLALVMTVEPGFGGQAFMADMLPKVAELRRLRAERGLGFLIQVDGGIDAATAPRALEAGADALVVGTAVFGKSDRAAAIAALRRAGA